MLAAVSSAATERLKSQYHCGLRAAGEPGFGADVAVSRMSKSAVSRTQVHRKPAHLASSISPGNCHSIASRTAGDKARNPRSDLSPEVRSSSHPATKATRYQAQRGRYQPHRSERETAKATQAGGSTRGDTAVMLRIGLLLGLVYVVFLMFWIWATRVRPRRTRTGRGI